MVGADAGGLVGCGGLGVLGAGDGGGLGPAANTKRPRLAGDIRPPMSLSSMAPGQAESLKSLVVADVQERGRQVNGVRR